MLRLEIKEVYLKANGNRDFVAQILNRSHYPRDQQTEHEAPLNIMWTKMGFHNNGIWTPDHFVALVDVVDALDFNKAVHVEEPEGINLTNITSSVTNEDLNSSHITCKISTPVRPLLGTLLLRMKPTMSPVKT